MKFSIYCFILIMCISGCNVNKNDGPKNKVANDSILNSIEYNEDVAAMNSIEFQLWLENYMKQLHFSGFRLLVEKKIPELLDTNRVIGIVEAVTLVKIYNTIFSYGLSNTGPYKLFQERFSHNIMKIVRILDCELSLGMGHYCPKYRLMIGGLAFSGNSYIVIPELD